MALWLVRAGKYGEHEQRFFADSACYLTWEGTEDRDLHQAKDYEGIKTLLAELYPDEKPKTRINWASQIAPFVFDIAPGDWVVMPHKPAPSRPYAGWRATTPRLASVQWQRRGGKHKRLACSRQTPARRPNRRRPIRGW